MTGSPASVLTEMTLLSAALRAVDSSALLMAQLGANPNRYHGEKHSPLLRAAAWETTAEREPTATAFLICFVKGRHMDANIHNRSAHVISIEI